MTPFDGARALWYVRPGTVSEATAEQMLATIVNRAPNINGILIKAWNWQYWAYGAEAKKPRAIAGQADLRYWVNLAHTLGLKAYAWGVARGADVAKESAIMRQVADSGVDALVIDVESGTSYFVGSAAAATSLARAAADTGVHVGLCFDYRGTHPIWSHAREFLPYANSLHPMCYHWHFQRKAVDVLTEMSRTLAAYNKPIVPALQGYSLTGRKYDPADLIPTARVALAQPGVVGLTWFRYGKGLTDREDGMGADDLAQLAALEGWAQPHPVEPTLFTFTDRSGRAVNVFEVRNGQWRTASGWAAAVALRAA